MKRAFRFAVLLLTASCTLPQDAAPGTPGSLSVHMGGSISSFAGAASRS